LQNIYNAFFKDNKEVLLINGEGGIGKTTIASKYYYTYENEYKFLIWSINKDGIDKTILNLANYEELNIQLNQSDTKQKQIEDVLKAIDKLDKPILFVIDNVDNIEDLNQNHQYLKKNNKYTYTYNLKSNNI